MCKTLCNVQLETYHVALVMDRGIFDCIRWMICVWDGFAQPQSCISYVHTGLSTHLYKRSLFSRERFDLCPRSQYMPRSFIFKCRLFALICVRQVRRWSGCNPRYLTSVCIGIGTLFIVTGGQSVCLVVNVTCADYAWMILVYHLTNRAWRMLCWCLSFCESTIGSVWTGLQVVNEILSKQLYKTYVGCLYGEGRG